MQGRPVLAVFLFEASGSLLGGMMLLFLTAAAQHFLAGGFLPLVFLPGAVRKLAAVSSFRNFDGCNENSSKRSLEFFSSVPADSYVCGVFCRKLCAGGEGKRDRSLCGFFFPVNDICAVFLLCLFFFAFRQGPGG